MKNINLAFLIIFSLFISSCSENSDPEIVTKYVGCTKGLENQGQCIRWMDRTIYFAFSSGSEPQRNNEFQKAKIQEALDEIQDSTLLGPGYFNYAEVDESLLNPLIEPGLSENEYKSFVLIWPDAVFNDFVVNELGGNTPDPNALAVINAAYKRKFYMIMKASCFVSDAACNGISTTGLKALVARQLGLITGLSPKSSDFCEDTPGDVMCTEFPEDSQWDENNKLRWASSYNNLLETILNNPNFYDEFVPEN